ncbi:chemotaxis protein CheB [Marinobacter sp. X15-166B]|uniref:chemotaxis protein CheB n=1 Tax=Marinobacter sp. X15-166B TaxID=1897620 RepID=UPI00085BCD01|nr:chemotaxis protein CheB [Marinobacter sp. X15-166B]OEY65862.1 chemotaxis protein CheB [Marinobacter sp. X15-166B]
MAGPAARPRVGIVADSVLQCQRMQAATARLGLDAGFSGVPDGLAAYPTLPQVQLWLVVLEDESAHSDQFDRLLADSDSPVLFGMQAAPGPNSTDYRLWERRLQRTLAQHLGVLETADAVAAATAPASPSAPEQDGPPPVPGAAAGEAARPAQQIWVLGASLGGPAAIKEFLDSLPPGLPVGFVYAQHIDGNFTEVLTRVLGRHAHYQFKRPVSGQKIHNGEAILLPVEHEWTLSRNGTLIEKDTPWPGPYSPSIDQVLLNVGDHYGPHCHAILFSGMGDDGARAAPFLRAHGSKIWVQDSASCGSSSMPDSVAATGCASFTGTPVQLAQQLVHTLAQPCRQPQRH